MRILVLGAGGIIGQHMIKRLPVEVDAIFARRLAYCQQYMGLDVTNSEDLRAFLQDADPDAIINLAGQNSPDVVERNPGKYRCVNVEVPAFLSGWAQSNGAHYVHVSSQAVFGGMPQGITQSHMVASFLPPYGPDSPRMPVNQYGLQKLQAEQEVMSAGKSWTIVRPTFVLGVRPLLIGRENPVEQMLSPVQAIAEGETVAVMRQVYDRWFSVSFAWDVAAKLWEVAMGNPQRRAIHVGIPFRTNRHILASYLRPDLNVEPVSHDSFEGLAPRPIDTTYAAVAESTSETNWHLESCTCGNCRDAQGVRHPVMVATMKITPSGSFAQIAEGLDRCKAEYEAREGK